MLGQKVNKSRRMIQSESFNFEINFKKLTVNLNSMAIILIRGVKYITTHPFSGQKHDL